MTLQFSNGEDEITMQQRIFIVNDYLLVFIGGYNSTQQQRTVSQFLDSISFG